MTSLPTNFIVGSPSSSHSVYDAIASYRRAQYLKVGSTVLSNSDVSVSSYDEEYGAPPIDEDAEDTFEDDPERTPRAEDLVDGFDWDDLVAPEWPDQLHSNTENACNLPASSRTKPPHVQPPRAPGPKSLFPHEGTPLLRKSISFSAVPHPRHNSITYGPRPIKDLAVTRSLNGVLSQATHQTQPKPAIRRSSTGSSKSARYNYGGKSTFGQTLFNSIAILLGIGMLSEPLAFAYAGWIGGTVLIVFYGYITCYTAKLLAHIILDDPRLRSYADIGRKAFGPRATPLTTSLFFLELFAVSVVLVTLYADSLHAIAPTHAASTYKLWGLIILIPTAFLPLSLLSYTSILGIISTVLIIIVVFIDGFTKKEGPGSLRNPAETSLGIHDWGELGVAFGLFMAGLSGHAVIPSLARDMIDPQEFDVMINWAFFIATALYTAIGYAGYLMFGRLVSDEVSRDLLETPGYNYALNQAALWMLVITPLTKFSLSTRPLNITFEIMLGLDSHLPPSSPEIDSAKPPLQSEEEATRLSRFHLKRMLIVVERAVFPLLSVGVSILIPEFSQAMAFLGSFSAFILCVIYPVSSKIALNRRCGFFDAFLLIVGIVMAVWGTVAAFVST